MLVNNYEFLRKNLQMIKNIIFDYDGTIADSVNIKTEAFAELYRIYGKEIERKVTFFILSLS